MHGRARTLQAAWSVTVALAMIAAGVEIARGNDLGATLLLFFIVPLFLLAGGVYSWILASRFRALLEELAPDVLNERALRTLRWNWQLASLRACVDDPRIGENAVLEAAGRLFSQWYVLVQGTLIVGFILAVATVALLTY